MPSKNRVALRNAQRRYYKRHGETVLFKYRAHRANAQARGIPFRLTFKQWVAIWNGSGKWNQRGNRPGQYCMMRPGDHGAYEIGNVRIALNAENHGDKCRNYPMFGEDNPAFGKDYWASQTPQARKKRKAQISAALKGRPKSKRMRNRLSQSTTGRRRVIRNGRASWAYPSDPDFPGI